VYVAGQKNRHSSAKGNDHDQVQRQSSTEQDRPGNPPIEPDHGKQQDRADYVERSGGVDRRRRVGRPQQSHRDLGGKRGEEQFQVLEAQLAEPADVASNQDRDGQRRSDDGEEQEHGLARSRGEQGCCRRVTKRRITKVAKSEADKGRDHEQAASRYEHERCTKPFSQRTGYGHTTEQSGLSKEEPARHNPASNEIRGLPLGYRDQRNIVDGARDPTAEEEDEGENEALEEPR